MIKGVKFHNEKCYSGWSNFHSMNNKTLTSIRRLFRQLIGFLFSIDYKNVDETIFNSNSEWFDHKVYLKTMEDGVVKNRISPRILNTIRGLFFKAYPDTFKYPEIVQPKKAPEFLTYRQTDSHYNTKQYRTQNREGVCQIGDLEYHKYSECPHEIMALSVAEIKNSQTEKSICVISWLIALPKC